MKSYRLLMVVLILVLTTGFSLAGDPPVPIQPNDALEQWAASGNVLYRTWRRIRYPQQPWETRIWFARSLDGGQTWEDPVPLNPANQYWRTAPIIAAGGPNVTVAWLWCEGFGGLARGYTDCQPELAESHDFGENFEITSLSVPYTAPDFMQIVAAGDGDRIYLAWNRCVPGCLTVSGRQNEIILRGPEGTRKIIEHLPADAPPFRLLVSGNDAYVWVRDLLQHVALDEK